MLSVERKLRISEGNEVFFSCRAEAISTKLNLAEQESESLNPDGKKSFKSVSSVGKLE